MTEDATTHTPAQLQRMATIRMNNLSDYTIALAHLVGNREWDKAAQLLHDMNLCMGILAGAVSQLLPVVKAGDAPEEKALEK